MKKLFLLAAALASCLSARAVWFTSAPGAAASGSAYTVAADEGGSSYTEVYLYKNGAFFAFGSGSGYASASGSSTDYGNQTITYEAYSSWYDDWWNYYGDYAATSVTITQPNNAPTIAWVQNPAKAAPNQWFAIQARGNDTDGNLTQVFVWRESVPHAFNGGGNGYESYSDANGYGQSNAGTVTFMAQATDSTGATSPVIYHSVSINTGPAVSWHTAPGSAWINENFTVRALGHDNDGNLAWTYVWRDDAPFAFNGGGNGYDSVTDANVTSKNTNGTITFKALAGDTVGDQSGFISHAVTINNRAPTMTPTVITGPTITWDATYGHYRMWSGTSAIPGSGTLTMASTIQDADSNLVNHTLRFRQVTINPALWYQLGGDTASGGTSTKQATLTTVETPGQWDFNAFGHDGIDSHRGESKTVWVYGTVNGATFVSQSINGTALTGAAPALSLNSGALTATATILMRNTGNKPWEKQDSNFNTPHRLGAIGPNHTDWGATRREMAEALVDPQTFPSPNDTATFTFTFSIPQTPGPHTFQWKMLEDGVAGDPFFEAATTAVTVNVVDTIPPTAPSSLTASLVTPTSFRLNWTASVENGPVLSYDVYRTISGVPTLLGNTTNTFYDVTGLQPRVAYTVKVVAKDGASPVLTTESGSLTITTPADPNADDDGDGIPNGWEQQYGLNLDSAADGPLDGDGDGLSNVAEYNLGKNPTVYDAGTSTIGGAIPAGWPNIGNPANSYAVGATSGSLQVDKSGGANYSVPLWVTPGSAGMQPQLSLNYSSQGGAGIAGFGWSLSGVSGISRGPQTRAVDGTVKGVTLTASDRFYLDGQRLIVINGGTYGANGAEYRTELDSLTRIISYGNRGSGPASFKAWTKAGLILEFGNTADSARGTSNGQPEAMSWMVNRISDTKGNYMTFDYTQDASTGLHVLQRINYTGNGSVAPYASVRFEYEDRPDWSQGYSLGSVISNLKRLTTVKSFYGETVAHSYTLNYRANAGTELFTDRSILASITEAGSDGKAYPPLTFEYAANDYGWTEAQSTYLPPYFLGDNTNSNRPAGSGFVDLNGDGRTDFVAYRVGAGGSTLVNVAVLNTGSGWSADNTNYHLPFPLADAANDTDTGMRLVDLNGDGLVDVVCRKYGSTGGEQQNQAYLNNGNGWTNEPNWRVPAPISRDGTQNDDNLRAGKFVDLNGDGRVDFVAHMSVGSGVVNLAVYLNTGSGFNSVPDGGYSSMPANLAKYKARFIDLNGDGLPDIAAYYVEGSEVFRKTYLNTGSGWAESTAYQLPQVIADGSHPTLGAEFVDANGDGLPDLVWFREMSNGVKRGVALNTGTGWFVLNVTTAPAFPGEPADPIDPAMQALYDRYAPPVALSRDGVTSAGSAIIDLNADGLPDITVCREFTNVPVDKRVFFGSQRSWYFAGTNFASGLPYLLLQPGITNPGADFVDLNGDGAVDAVWFRKHANSSQFGSVQINHANPLADRLTKVTNGFGVSAGLTYGSLLDPAVYTKGSGGPAGSVNVIGPMYVVQSVSNDDGVGGQYVVNYGYGGLRSDPVRGSLGFETMTVTDSRTGIASSSTFSQVYPFIGMAVASETKTSGGTTLSSSSVTYAEVAGMNAGTHLPYAAQSVQSSYELNGGLIVTTTTSVTGIDTKGNVTGMTVSTNDGFSKTTTNAYTEDNAALWLLGRLTSSSVTSAAPGVGSQTRTSSFHYDATTGLLLTETVQPGDPVLALTTTYGYDAFGNKTSVQVSGPAVSVDAAGNVAPTGGAATRTTVSAYDVRGRFPVSTTNALGHTETYPSYNETLGVLLQMTGANGLPTSWSYDGMGRKIQENRADGTASFIRYKWAGSDSPPGAKYLVETESTGAAPSLAFYDAFGRVFRSHAINGDGKMVYQDTLFDSLGRAYAKSNPYFNNGSTVYWTQTTSFDVLNRPLTVATPDDAISGGYAYTTYSYNGLTSSATDPKGRVSVTTKNSQGWTVANTRNNNAAGGATATTVSYSYDALGNLTGTNAAGVATSLAYDLRGRKLSMADPDMGSWLYRYNAFGELIWQRDAKGQIVTLAYDSLGRLTSRVETEGTTTWTYDTAANGAGTWKGKLGSLSAPGGYVETYAYDSLGRPSSVSRTIDGLPYTFSTTYDSVGRPLRTVYPVGVTGTSLSTRNVYNAYGYLKEIRNYLATDDGRPNGQLQGLVYWQADHFSITGRIDGEIYGNGLANDRVYSDATGRLSRATIDRGTTVGAPFFVQDLAYTYDAVGNVLTRTSSVTGFNRTEAFTYDGLDRLTSHALNAAAPVTTAFDAAGNITTKSDVGGYTYGVGAGPHAVTTAGPNNYSYDANGNMLAGANRTIDWTSFNQVKKITQGSLSTEFSFGGGHERVKQVRKTGSTVTDTTIYVGSLYEKVTTTAGTLVEHKHYLMAPTGRIAVVTQSTAAGSLQANTTRYFHTDGLGSITAVSDEKGAVLKRYAYDGWGKQSTLFTASGGGVTNTAPTTRGYTDHEMLADFGLIHMNGRIYDPILGRFLSADPNVDGADDAQGFNRYSYVSNNPLFYTDPTGHLKFWKDVLGPIVQFVATVYFGPLGGALVGLTIDGWKGAVQGFASGIGGGLFGRVGYGFASGFSGSLLNGGSIGDAFKSGVIGGAQAYVAGKIGDKFGHSIGDFGNEAGRATAHGLLGGAVEEARGGEFRHGFYAAFIGSAAGSIAGTYLQGNETWKFAARTTIAAVAGGTASVLGGGKFANGALTAAFQHMFNHEGGYWSEVFNTGQGYALGASEEGTGYSAGDGSTGSESGDIGRAAGQWTVRILSAPKGLLKGLFKGALKAGVKSGGDDLAKLAVNSADDAARMTQWGWRGGKTWRDGVKAVSKGGTLESIAGKIPSRADALDMIKQAGGRVIRIESGHLPPNPHIYPHINFETAAGLKGTIKIGGL
ncbi:MAG: VCBS repeat-containing protein [Opitutae bacterium]|nr:VCBS repeat-containing protein [Opitutae bacterium]